jgi:hypothetical protein
MTRLALLLDQHPNAHEPDRPVRRVVIAPFENTDQIEDELTRTYLGAVPFHKVGIVEVPPGDPEGILTEAHHPLTTTAIFTITTIKTRKPETEGERRLPDGMDVVIASSRSLGVYPTLALAKRCVEENWLHITEFFYDYAVIEEVAYGPYPDILSSHWYRRDAGKDAFMACEKPEWLGQAYGGFVFG